MKSIVYALLAIFISGLVSTGCNISQNSHTETILLQSKERDVSTIYLQQSVDIMKNRLKNFTSEKFEVSLLEEKNQIKVSFTGSPDKNIVTELLVQKGELSFHELVDRKSLSELLNDDNHLFALLNSGNGDLQDAMIGCISVSDVNEVNDYLATIGFDHDIRFVWSRASKNSDVCLYAIRLSVDSERFISEANINSIKSDFDTSTESYEVKIEFRKSAVDKWAEMTRMNINKSIAIVLDNSILYVPVIRSEIKSGVFTITGNFTETESRFIASLLGNGVLPVEFEVVN